MGREIVRTDDSPAKTAHADATASSTARGSIVGPWRIGLVAIGLLFGVGGGLSAFAPLSTAVVADGAVASDGARRAAKPLESGVIGTISIREGDRVSAGQVVIELEDTRIRAEIAATRQQLRQAAAREARLLSERDGLDAPRFAHWSIDDVADPNVLSARRAEANLFNARGESYRTERAMLERRIAQLQAQEGGHAQRLEALERQSRYMAQEVSGVAQLVNKGLTRRSRLLELQRQQAQIDGQVGQARAEMARTAEQIGSARIEFSRLDAARLETLSADLAAAQTERLTAEETLVTLRDRLEKTKIRAIADGEVIALAQNAPGAVVEAGETLFEIVPEQTTLLIEARVRPADIEDVAVGKTTRISFSTLNLPDADNVIGAVDQVSGDVFATEGDQQPYYKVVVSVLEEELAEKLPGFQPIVGIPAQVFIKGEPQTVLQYLMKPVNRVVDQGMRET